MRERDDHRDDGATMAPMRAFAPALLLAAAILVDETVGFIHSSTNVRLCTEASASSQTEESPSQQLRDGCPFSKAFPRFRIEFTSVNNTPDSFSIPFFSKIQSAMEKSRFLRNNDNAQWLEGYDGVKAYAALWRLVADLSRSETTQSMVVAFPDSNKRLLQRFIDILQWSNEESCVETPVRVNAVLVDDDTTFVPALTLTRIGTPSRLVNENAVDPAIVTKRTQAWVKRILVDLSICPFTKAVTKSGQGLSDLGVPVGSITYDTSNAMPTQIYNLMADTWESIHRMLEAGPSGKDGVSSILLAAPAFDKDFDVWSGPVFAMLEAGVIASGAEKEVGVVCFHPAYATPDGSSFPGFGHMHSVPRLQKWLKESGSFQEELSEEQVAAGGAWQRRTPHATINVLRADQLEIAEKRRTTGNLYTTNINKLVGKEGLGSAKLAADLERERQISS